MPAGICCGYLLELPHLEKSALSRAMYINGAGGGGGGGGCGREVWGGRGGNFLYMALYGCACRIAPFFSTARYMIGSLFSTKSI